MASTGTWTRPRAVQAIVTVAIVVALLLLFRAVMDVTWAVIVLAVGVTIIIGIQRRARARERREQLARR